MNRFDIVALTLAEVALVVLFAFVAVIFPGYGKVRRDNKSLDAKNSSLAADNQKLKTDNQRLKEEMSRLRADAAKQLPLQLQESNRTGLRSKAMPSCIEVHKATRPLFTVIISGPGLFEVGGRPFSLPGLLRAYSTELSLAERDQCRHQVDVQFAQGISTPAYVRGLKSLREHFYTGILGESE